jgi:hypothetical protein
MEKTNELNTNNIKCKRAIIFNNHGTLDVFPDSNRRGIGDRDIELEDVEIDIDENGLMHITGEQIEFDYLGGYGYDLDYEDLKKEGKYILKEKLVYKPKFMWWSYGQLMYHGGWTEIKKRSHYEGLTSNYRISKIT